MNPISPGRFERFFRGEIYNCEMKRRFGHIKGKLPFLVIFLLVLAVNNCGPTDKEAAETTPVLTLAEGDMVYSGSVQQFMKVAASGAWTIALEYPEGTPSGWCSASPDSGSGEKNVRVGYSANTDENDRTVDIIATTPGGLKGKVTLTQSSGSMPDSGGTPTGESDVDKLLKRLEMPAAKDRNWVFNYSKGDFSLEYYPAKKHPRWVAWTLHKGHAGTVGRNERWQYDSRIPRASQPNSSDFTNAANDGKDYIDRGHMCPSADRQATVESNRETFYYSNMSPQYGDLNQGIWAKVEDLIRGWRSDERDTLYICCGGTLEKEANILAYTNGMAIPKYNFKVVLRKKQNTTYEAIGFWFENTRNSSYRDIAPSNAGFLSTYCKTIREIETLTGLDFYPNLEAIVGTDAYNQIESNKSNPNGKWPGLAAN